VVIFVGNIELFTEKRKHRKI